MKNIKTVQPIITQSAITEAFKRQNKPRIDPMSCANRFQKQAMQAYERGEYALAIILADKAIERLERHYQLTDNQLRKLSPSQLRKIKAMPSYALFQKVPAMALLIMEYASEVKEDAQYAIEFEHYSRNFMKSPKVAVCA